MFPGVQNTDYGGYSGVQPLQVNLSVPNIDNSCEKIRIELQSIKASSESLVLEYRRLYAQNAELEQQARRYFERSYLMNLEMVRHREVTKRLETVIVTFAEALSPDDQLKLSNAVYSAKQIDTDELKNLANQQIQGEYYQPATSGQISENNENQFQAPPLQMTLPDLLQMFLDAANSSNTNIMNKNNSNNSTIPEKDQAKRPLGPGPSTQKTKGKREMKRKGISASQQPVQSSQKKSPNSTASQSSSLTQRSMYDYLNTN